MNARHPLAPPLWPPLAASAWGDDRWDSWIEIEVAGVVQRLRWIAPGSFWMGSPEKEADRRNDEGPRHRVTLTHGFWLADTACTQAMWLAVMGGENPSHFNKSGLRCPVEQVSWHDVQAFLARLQAHVPDLEPGLPTEAEWEYACRAGTETPFAFGETLSSEQANFDGNHPYGGAKKGPFREKTIPVKQFEPNGWGLHEMHGQVWEWCADAAYRKYGAEAASDPGDLSAPGQEGPRAVRGGSWFNLGRGARSAQRSPLRASYRGDGLGFRFALRSTSQARPGQEAGRDDPPQGPSATGGRRRGR
jgi:formylglycine-generating enzyme